MSKVLLRVASILFGLLSMPGCDGAPSAQPEEAPRDQVEDRDVDTNGDGALRILVLGTSESIKSAADPFSPDRVATELQNILSADEAVSLDVSVVAEDIYRTRSVPSGIAGSFTAELTYSSHSLVQYFYWPDGRNERMDNLAGQGNEDWDHVVLAADPHIVATLPGYHALGVNKIAAKVREGGAVPTLLMTWPKDEGLVPLMEEFTYRAADGASAPLATVPAGLAWAALPAESKDDAVAHPTPNGAYLAAAAIYAHLYSRSASSSLYDYDDALANVAESTVVTQRDQIHYEGALAFASPFRSCDISDETLVYNHTGTSTENGILGGLQWVTSEAERGLEFGATPPIHFNYGRSSMGGGTKEYTIDPSLFDFSFGFPLQDDASSGDESMLYGLDKRVSEADVETDLGVAFHMVNQSELPHGRTVPMRTLAAQLLDEVPGFDLYSDNWHLSADLDKAIAAYMYTVLTGECALEDESEPEDATSSQWRTWMAHRIGYETAWSLMYMEENTPCYGAP